MNSNEFILLIPFNLFIFDDETTNNKTMRLDVELNYNFRKTSLKEYNKYLE